VRAIYQQAGAFNSALFNFAVRYVGEHPGLERDFTLQDDDLRAFYRALPEWSVTVDRDDFQTATRFVRFHLEREIALQAWGEPGQFLRGSEADRQLARALELLRGVESTEELFRRAASGDTVAPREGA
jgi:hypothetical protein